MVSARAKEYIARFSKAVQKKTALEQIVKYRDECKSLYREAESKNPMNYRAAEDKRVYLEDMLERIHCLGDARDYLQKEITKPPSKTTAMHSAVAFVPSKETKPAKSTKTKYFQRTETDLRKLGIKDANVVKYILRFQGLGVADNYTYPCQEAVEAYQEEWYRNKESDPTDYAYCERADIATDALDTALSYFVSLQDIIDAEGHDEKYVYNAGTDEYVPRHVEPKPAKKTTKKTTKKPEYEDSDEFEDFSRVWGRT